MVDERNDNGVLLGVPTSLSGDEWILDSGCTYYLCPNKDWFASYRSIDGGGVLIWEIMFPLR